MKRTATTMARRSRAPDRLSKKRLAEMIEEATVDAYDESEQASGWYTMFQEYLELPFETTVLGVTVTVANIDRRALAGRRGLLRSLEQEPEEDEATVAAAWAADIERRIRENAPGIPADTVFAEGRARLHKRS